MSLRYKNPEKLPVVFWILYLYVNKNSVILVSMSCISLNCSFKPFVGINLNYQSRIFLLQTTWWMTRQFMLGSTATSSPTRTSSKTFLQLKSNLSCRIKLIWWSLYVSHNKLFYNSIEVGFYFQMNKQTQNMLIGWESV